VAYLVKPPVWAFFAILIGILVAMRVAINVLGRMDLLERLQLATPRTGSYDMEMAARGSATPRFGYSMYATGMFGMPWPSSQTSQMGV
jgi:hypothetical protein